MEQSSLGHKALINVSEADLYSQDFYSKWLRGIIVVGEKSVEELTDILFSMTRFQLYKLYRFNSMYGHLSLDESVPNFNQILGDIIVAKCFDERGALFPDAVITEWTWDLINRANHNGEELGRFLINMAPNDFERFYDETTYAGSVFNDDLFIPYMEYLSEDGIRDLGLFIVGQGKDFYYDVWKNPEKISLAESEQAAVMENIVISAKSDYYRHLWELKRATDNKG